MNGIVVVHIRVHGDTLFPELFVILGPRQRYQDEELQAIHRQLPLDDLDIPQDALAGVGGKTKDVTGTGHGTGIVPGVQHLPILGDVVLGLTGTVQGFRIDALQADKHLLHAGSTRFLDEAADLVTQGVYLDGEFQIDSVFFAKLDQPVEQRLPDLVSGEVVVGDEEFVDTLVDVGANDALHVIGGAVA